MFGVRHNLVREFPEFGTAIFNLKSNNTAFASLLHKYDVTDKKIYGIEMQRRPVSDRYVEDLKKERLVLKDRIYSMLRSDSSL